MKKALFMFIVAVTYGIAAAVNPSGTMPIIYINTTGNQQITSTEEYITATFYIDALNPQRIFDTLWILVRSDLSRLSATEMTCGRRVAACCDWAGVWM